LTHGAAYHTAQTLKHDIEDDRDTLLTVSISSVCERISAIRDAFHEASILLKTFGETNRGPDILRRGYRPDRKSRITAPDARCLQPQHRKPAQVCSRLGCPRNRRGTQPDLTSNEMHSVLYRYYVLMDLTNTAIRIIRDFNPDTIPAVIAEHFAGLPEGVPVRHV
jgi:hypothetical protein